MSIVFKDKSNEFKPVGVDLSEIGNKIYISYKIEEIIRYKEINEIIPNNLITLCNENKNKNEMKIKFREIFIKKTKEVIDNYLSGKNPNDIIIKNIIIENLNKVSYDTYNKCIEILKRINYNKREHYEILIYELIMRSMTDNIVIKNNIDIESNKYSISNICACIVLDFSNLQIKTNNEKISFENIIRETCETYFEDYINKEKHLDKNNLYRIDNFKGFMNFIGLLYNKKIIREDTIITYIKELKELILNESWEPYEINNVYDGYMKLLNQILLQNENINKNIINEIKSIHNEIIIKNKVNNKLRKLALLYHNDIEIKLNEILEKMKKV